MNTLEIILGIILLLIAVALIVVITLQRSQKGGLGGAIGGGMLEASLGADAGNVLIKTTAILGAIFLLNTLVLARLTSTVNARSIMNQEPEPTVEQAPALPMAAPELPAQAPAAPQAPALPAAPAAPAAPAK